LFVIVFLHSLAGWGQLCCYNKIGELIPYFNGGGTVIRMSADWQPLPYLRQEYWNKILCIELANDWQNYRKIRPSDDCTRYHKMPRHGTF